LGCGFKSLKLFKGLMLRIAIEIAIAIFFATKAIRHKVIYFSQMNYYVVRWFFIMDYG